MSKYRIEFGDVKLGEISWNHLAECHKTSMVSGGKKVKQFEEELAKLFNAKHAIATSSGTDACLVLVTTLYDNGAKRGDEIILPALGFVATANAVLAAGFIPKFVDIEADTLNINPNLVEQAISEKTRAIFAVDTMGKPCDYTKLKDIADRHNITLLGDCCESYGSKHRGKFAFEYCTGISQSHYIAHILACGGEGGSIVSNDDRVNDLARSIRTHGRKNGSLYFDHVLQGYNSKMNDLEASIGLEQITMFWDTFNKRKYNLKKMVELTKDLDQFAWFNKEESYEECCGHAFSITLKDPKYDIKKLDAFLDSKSIKTKRNFGSVPQHLAFKWMDIKPGTYPVSEYVGDNGIHIGCHQYLTEDDLIYVSDCLHEYFGIKL